MATVQCIKCTAERRGFRRELDSWRHKLIHCIGFESILEGTYGPLLLRDLNLFADCEPEEVDDWSPEGSCSQCSFCNFPLDKLSDQVPAASSPLSSPSEYSPCQAPTTTESQSAHRFLQAVFHKKDLPTSCDSNIPLIAQELMKKMIHQFAIEYASECLLQTNANGVTRTSSPLSEASDAPLDLTVSRTQEGKETESEPDGVLDLSNRNSASSTTSSSSSSSAAAANHKASGFPQASIPEVRGLQAQRGTRFCCVLDAVLSSLCRAHHSLIYQILKLAHQENLLLFVDHRHEDQTESHCCPCDVKPQAAAQSVPPSECRCRGCSLSGPQANSDHPTLKSTEKHPEDSKSTCSSKSFTSDSQQGSSCVQTCETEKFAVACSKELRCIPCRSSAGGRIHNVARSFAPSPPLSQSSSCSCCSPSCCSQHHVHSGACHPDQDCLTHVKIKQDGDGDPPCPVLKREQSFSPPPLSPIPTDVNEKADETPPPSLLHHKQEEPSGVRVVNGLVKVSHQEPVVDSTEVELNYKNQESNESKQNPSGTLLQDVMNRFSEKLETIRPLDKDPALLSTTIYVSEKEARQAPSTSRDLQFPADAHLTEIITTVLHTGRASDYNLSDLINRHEDRESKSPKTRLRHRQEVLAAIATSADDTSTRRHTLQIKRELAMLDQSCNKKRMQAKKPRLKDGCDGGTVSQPNVVKDAAKKETDAGALSISNHKINEVHFDSFPSESNKGEVKEESQTSIVPEELQVIKAEGKESKISCEEEKMNISDIQTPTPELQCKQGGGGGDDDGVKTQEIIETTTNTPAEQCCGHYEGDEKGDDAVSEKKLDNLPSGKISVTEMKVGEGQEHPNHVGKGHKCQSNHSEKARRSGRSIVPPQRFSSYVTEPRKMFFVACFSERIFNRDAQKETDLTQNGGHVLTKTPDAEDTQLESTAEKCSSLAENPGTPPTEATQEQHGPPCTEPKGEMEVVPQAAKETSPVEDGSDNKTNRSDCDATPVKTLRSSPRRPRLPPMALPSSSSQGSASSVGTQFNSHLQYTSPIKLMFVSQVKDKDGVRYSLKSAGSGSGSKAEHFDPCEESSWSGAPERHRSRSRESAPSKAKSICSPLKSATSRTRSAPLPPIFTSSPSKSASLTSKSAPSSPKSASSSRKLAHPTSKSAPSSPKSSSSPRKSASSTPQSASSPLKSSSPRSAAASPKNGLRRSAEGTPTKRIPGSESQGHQGDLPTSHETTPPKRRPGRPKKLGPQLEQKVKRPIGRPRKQKPEAPVAEANPINGKGLAASDVEENVNKNLKITVMYGRSRRNKRLVSESFDQLQTEFSDACQAVGLKRDFGLLLQNSQTSSGSVKRASEELNFVSPEKELVLQSSSNVKCQKQCDSMPSRKPGRPAKVKISGISVTVTTVSPRQRKIQMNKDTRQSPKTPLRKRALLPQFKSAEDSCTLSKRSQAEEVLERGTESKGELSIQPVVVRHSMRVRKPSVHFLRAVATSSFRSYSRSNALLRRSKQLLLNKASNERRQEEQQNCAATPVEERPLPRPERNATPQELNKVAGVSVGSIFTPKETLRWWAASAEEQTLNHELARRIRVISDTWVSDSRENKEMGTKGSSAVSRKSKRSSVVRTLFDCSPNKPRSCSMQQICSWFMQTTETQSLAIVKKVSARNLYDPAQFSRSANKISVCNSPQAERLRKHVKKFAKTVPKTPSQHREAQRRLSERNKGTPSTRRRLFPGSLAEGQQRRGPQGLSSRASDELHATLTRARRRFLTRKDRMGWQKRQSIKKGNVSILSSDGDRATRLQPKRNASWRAAKGRSDCLKKNSSAIGHQTQEPADVSKELNLSSKAWSPETLKECRVFLRKINSPDNESTEEEWDSCTVTLDDGTPSACLFAGGGRGMVGVIQAVKTERKRRLIRRTASTEVAGSTSNSVLQQDETSAKRQRGKYGSAGVVSAEPPQSPPTKILRQSRMRGLTGPKWSDFVFES